MSCLPIKRSKSILGPCHLLTLPDEMLVAIFDYLPLVELARTLLTCHNLYRMACYYRAKLEQGHVFEMTDLQYWCRGGFKIIFPYIGFRIVKLRNNRLYDNYKVIASNPNLNMASVVKVNMYGDEIENKKRFIRLCVKLGFWRYCWDGNYETNKIIPGIATDEGFMVTSFIDPAIHYKSTIRRNSKGLIIPELGLIANMNFRLNNLQYVITNIDKDGITLKYIGTNERAHTIKCKWQINRWIVSEVNEKSRLHRRMRSKYNQLLQCRVYF